MAKVTIGGEQHNVPVLTIKGIKKIWPIVQQAQEAKDPIEAIDHAVKIIAVSLALTENLKASQEEIDTKAEWVEETMRGDETSGLRDSMRQILTESGLLNPGAKPGEALGDAPMVPNSTEISTE